MLFDDHFGHIQAQPGTYARPLGGKIGIEYPFDDLVIYAAGIITDLYYMLRFFLITLDKDLWFYGFVFNKGVRGIFENVQEYLHEFIGIGQYGILKVAVVDNANIFIF